MSHLMWPYQPHFRVAQRQSAKRAFEALDTRFDPELFLVGFLSRPSSSRPVVCLEPSEDFWLTPDDFAGLPLLRSGYAALDVGEGTTPSALSHSPRYEKHLRRTIRDAVMKVIEQHAGWPGTMSYWVALPVPLGRYWISVVVGLQNEVLRSHVALRDREVTIRSERRIRVPVSLIDAAMEEYLERVSLEVMRPQAGRQLSAIDPEELLRAAGRRLMSGLVWRIDSNSVDGMPDLFRTFTTVSSLHYEKTEVRGSIFLARRDHPALDSRIEFSSSARMRHHGHARKLLELTSSELALHSDSDRIFNLVHVHRDRLADEDIFEVRIYGHHHWELLHNARPLMRVQYGQPSLPRTRINQAKLRIDLKRIFEGISDDDCACLVSLVEQAVEESHGTMLVISADARREAQRLAAQCIPVVPRLISSELLRHLTPIDGAVLLSPDGMCHAIGTILDGIASAKGDPSRGARYNSAVRYVASTKAPCLAVVVSENGTVDYVPDLRPPIARAEIENRLRALEALQQNPRPRSRAYAELIGWLEAHRFYLLREHCVRLNRIVATLDEMLSSNDPQIQSRGPYVPDPQMDERLYYTDSTAMVGTATVTLSQFGH